MSALPPKAAIGLSVWRCGSDVAGFAGVKNEQQVKDLWRSGWDEAARVEIENEKTLSQQCRVVGAINFCCVSFGAN